MLSNCKYSPVTQDCCENGHFHKRFRPTASVHTQQVAFLMLAVSWLCDNFIRKHCSTVHCCAACSAYILHTPLKKSRCRQQGSPLHTHTHTHMHTYTYVHAHTHTHLYLYCWLRGPHSGGEPAGGNKTGGPIGRGTPASSSQLHGPLSAVGVLIYGLARPMR